LLARHGELVGEGENYEETYLLCHIVARTGSSSSYAERIG
jgi:hypothetical protein